MFLLRIIMKFHHAPHIPVLLDEVLHTFDRILNPCNPHFLDSKTTHSYQPCIIDCTLGFGGMSKALLQKYVNLHICGIDRDSDAICFNTALQHEFSNRLQLYQGSFAEMLPQILQEKRFYLNLSSQNNSKESHCHAIQPKTFSNQQSKLVGILADIGVSSYQLDTLSRGFSFQSKILDMRMDTTQTFNASSILQHYSRMELERVFREYGEIREYKKLANLIIEERKKGEINAESLHSIALKLHTKGKIHPATLIYQALRLEVNDELGQLRSLLQTCQNLRGILLCIISFHSLEDRIVKEAFKQWSKTCICPAENLKCECGNNHAKGVILYKKPLTAQPHELHHNKRARSAKLRAFYFFE